MRAFFRFVAFFLLAIVAGIVLFNISNSIAIETSFFSLRTNVGFLILFCSILGSLITLLLLFSFGVSLKSSDSKFKKQIENAKLTSEIESDKVKQLEAKIKTLEEALRSITHR